MKIDSSSGYLILVTAILLLCGCAVLPSGNSPSPEDRSIIGYPELPSADLFVITARVRIDLPKYRVRGSCRITRFPEGSLQVDFLHSSLFGSYREDVTIYIERDSIYIQDHERGKIYDNNTTLSLLEEHFGFRIYADDLMYLLLLAEPSEDGRIVAVAGAWDLGGDSGDWRGRNLVVNYGENGLPARFRQCMIESTICYDTKYKYGEFSGYPEKIVIENESGPERVSIEVIEVKEEVLTLD